MTEAQFIREFANNLQGELEYSYTSQKELSEMTGITESAISRYVNGERMPSLKNVIKIARALECSVGDLIDLDADVK